jgi:hypothetical protein
MCRALPSINARPLECLALERFWLGQTSATWRWLVKDLVMEFGQASHDVLDVLVGTIARDPVPFAGVTVRLEGWITLQHENVAIYADPEAMRKSHSSETIHTSLRRSVWLEVGELSDGRGKAAPIWKALIENNMSLEGPGVAEGVVDPASKGHLNLWPAGLSPVRRLILGNASADWPYFDWAKRKAER